MNVRLLWAIKTALNYSNKKKSSNKNMRQLIKIFWMNRDSSRLLKRDIKVNEAANCLICLNRFIGLLVISVNVSDLSLLQTEASSLKDLRYRGIIGFVYVTNYGKSYNKILKKKITSLRSKLQVELAILMGWKEVYSWILTKVVNIHDGMITEIWGRNQLFSFMFA